MRLDRDGAEVRWPGVCDGPRSCPDAPEGGARCPACPVARLELALQSEAGELLGRVRDLSEARENGVRYAMTELTWEEHRGMSILRQEQAELERERAKESHHGR